MRHPKAIVFAIVAALVVVAPAAAGPLPDAAVPDPTAAPVPTEDAPPGTTYVHVHSTGHLTTDGGSVLILPPGYYIDEASWGRLDAEMRRLQDAETRLTAENGVYKGAGGPGIGWGTLLVAGLAVLAGAAIDHFALH